MTVRTHRPSTNLLVLFGRNGAGKSLVINEFAKHLQGNLGGESAGLTQITSELELDPSKIADILCELTLGLKAHRISAGLRVGSRSQLGPPA